MISIIQNVRTHKLMPDSCIAAVSGPGPSGRSQLEGRAKEDNPPPVGSVEPDVRWYSEGNAEGKVLAAAGLFGVAWVSTGVCNWLAVGRLCGP